MCLTALLFHLSTMLYHLEKHCLCPYSRLDKAQGKQRRRNKYNLEEKQMPIYRGKLRLSTYLAVVPLNPLCSSCLRNLIKLYSLVRPLGKVEPLGHIHHTQRYHENWLSKFLFQLDIGQSITIKDFFYLSNFLYFYHSLFSCS